MPTFKKTILKVKLTTNPNTNMILEKLPPKTILVAEYTHTVPPHNKYYKLFTTPKYDALYCTYGRIGKELTIKEIPTAKNEKSVGATINRIEKSKLAKGYKKSPYSHLNSKAITAIMQYQDVKKKPRLKFLE